MLYVADLVAECHGCCTQAKNDLGTKFQSAVLEVCSHRLRYMLQSLVTFCSGQVA